MDYWPPRLEWNHGHMGDEDTLLRYSPPAPSYHKDDDIEALLKTLFHPMHVLDSMMRPHHWGKETSFEYSYKVHFYVWGMKTWNGKVINDFAHGKWDAISTDGSLWKTEYFIHGKYVTKPEWEAHKAARGE